MCLKFFNELDQIEITLDTLTRIDDMQQIVTIGYEVKVNYLNGSEANHSRIFSETARDAAVEYFQRSVTGEINAVI